MISENRRRTSVKGRITDAASIDDTGMSGAIDPGNAMETTEYLFPSHVQSAPEAPFQLPLSFFVPDCDV